MATKTTADAKREAAQRAPIQTRGLEDADYPYKIVADELRDRIKRGVFRPGDTVPSIANLMDHVRRGEEHGQGRARHPP